MKDMNTGTRATLWDEPILINRTELRTRIVMPPMATNQSAIGHVTPAHIEHYRTRAGNAELGLIITEHLFPTEVGRLTATQLSIADDGDIEGLAELVGVIRNTSPGIRVFAQLNHAGAMALGADRVAPSAGDFGKGPARALTLDEIEVIEAAFATSARRAKAAGYDGVEIHSAHGYLLNQFFSPLTNHREDGYGPQSYGSRLRIHLETVAGVREAVGDDFPVAVRLGGCDYLEGGSTIADAVAAARLLEDAGVDLLDLSGGICRYTREGHTEPGYFGDMSRAVKEAVSIPVLVTGGVQTLEQAEELLQEGVADLIGIGRALLRDPHLT